jgi:hypothetical protein
MEGQIQVDLRHRKEIVKLLSLSGDLIGDLSGEENRAQLVFSQQMGFTLLVRLEQICCIE